MSSSPLSVTTGAPEIDWDAMRSYATSAGMWGDTDSTGGLPFSMPRSVMVRCWSLPNSLRCAYAGEEDEVRR